MINKIGYQDTIDILKRYCVKYEVHNFPSGASMIDIWHRGLFYVVQFESGFIGFSEVNEENPGFDTIPDMKFYDVAEFKIKLESLVNK